VAPRQPGLELALTELANTDAAHDGPRRAVEQGTRQDTLRDMRFRTQDIKDTRHKTQMQKRGRQVMTRDIIVPPWGLSLPVRLACSVGSASRGRPQRAPDPRRT